MFITKKKPRKCNRHSKHLFPRVTLVKRSNLDVVMVMQVFDMDIHLILRGKKQSIFVLATESTTALQLTEAVHLIAQKSPDEMLLYLDDQVLEDNKCFHEYNLLNSTATVFGPATIGMAFKIGDEFEELETEDF